MLYPNFVISGEDIPAVEDRNLSATLAASFINAHIRSTMGILHKNFPSPSD